MPQATTRLELRLSAELHAMLKRAAELQGRSVTDFVTAAVQSAAQQAIEQAEVMRLSMVDQVCFTQALLTPQPANAAMQRAFRQRKQLLRSNARTGGP